MKLIIATGISGCGRTESLDRFEEYCISKNKKIKIYHVGKMMIELVSSMGLEINKENILNADAKTLHILRTSVLNRIVAEIENNSDCDAVIICVHTFFYWKSIIRRAFDKFLCKFEADMFVTFIDDFRSILARLNERSQWKAEGLTNKDILIWQNVEVETTASLAQIFDKPFFVVPTASNQSLLYKLIFHPDIEPVYITMPISHFREPEQRITIDKFVSKLEQYFAVFNPLSVEVVGAIFIDTESSKVLDNDFTIERHLVYRDQSWFVGQAKKVICYWPLIDCPVEVKKNPEVAKLWLKAIPSPGMNHETHQAYIDTKDVWVVFLGVEASPFIVSYSTRKDLFYSEESFFNFLEAEYPDRKKIVW